MLTAYLSDCIYCHPCTATRLGGRTNPYCAATQRAPAPPPSLAGWRHTQSTDSFLSYWYTQRAGTARRHFQNGGYMALLEAKTSFYSEQRRKLEFFLPNNQKSFGLKLLLSCPRSFRVPIRHVRCCRYANFR